MIHLSKKWKLTLLILGIILGAGLMIYGGVLYGDFALYRMEGSEL